MLLLLNSKNDNVKKDLRLAYSQGNTTAYPLNLESMVRYLLSTYSIKSTNNSRDKKGNKNGKKGDEPKSKDYNTPSDGSSIDAHVSEVKKPDDLPT